MTGTTILMRHGPKNPSSADKCEARGIDRSLANQLTEEGRRAAHQRGAFYTGRGGYTSLRTVTPETDRNRDTAWFMGAGFAGVGYDTAVGLHGELLQEGSQAVYDHTYGSTIDARLTQQVPRVDPEGPAARFKRGDIDRDTAMEQCYAMLSAASEVPRDAQDRVHMLAMASLYVDTVLEYHAKDDVQKYDLHLQLLIGNDPGLGAALQLLKPKIVVPCVAPLEGVAFTQRNDTGVTDFEFTSPDSEQYKERGVITPSFAEVIKYTSTLGPQ
jgi:hypothetical protein